MRASNTKSDPMQGARRNALLTYFEVAFVLGTTLIFMYIGSHIERGLPGSSSDPSAIVRIGMNTIRVGIAGTEDARERGLGGRDSLDPDEGMLFVFSKDDTYAFWMKDMHFPIDIIWFARDGTIVDFKESIAPDTYPLSFSPKKPAHYVLEVPAGYVHAHGIWTGSTVILPKI